MNKFTSFLAIVCLLVANTGYAQNHWRVNNALGIDADFTTIQAAFDTASANDIVYIEGTNIPYASATLNKPLTVIGPGYFLASNDSTQANLSSSLIGEITLGSASTGSYLAGLTMNTLYLWSSNVIIERNNITSIYIGWNGFDVGSVVIRQNYIGSIDDHGSYTSAIIENNIVTSGITSSQMATWLIYNNTIQTGWGVSIQVYNSSIKNNIIKNTYPSNDYYCINTDPTRNNNIKYNICNKLPNTQPPPPENLWGVDMTQVIAGTGNNETRFYLIEGSLATGYGENGIDCGAFGNITPYVLSGMPPVPHIFKASIPVSATTTGGLPVDVKIKSQK
jgi:hypothetical protein